MSGGVKEHSGKGSPLNVTKEGVWPHHVCDYGSFRASTVHKTSSRLCAGTLASGQLCDNEAT